MGLWYVPGQNYERLKQSLPRLNFEYSDPSPGFNRAKVKGPAATLISLEEMHYNKATALEIAAGGKLYNIVVEDEQVGKDLIKNGQLRKRITIIPLNKITAYKLPAKVRKFSSLYMLLWI
jgi:structural maintenance of chromosome 2